MSILFLNLTRWWFRLICLWKGFILCLIQGMITWWLILMELIVALALLA